MHIRTALKGRSVHKRDMLVRGSSPATTGISCSYSVMVIMMAITILCLVLNLHHMRMNGFESAALMHTNSGNCTFHNHSKQTSVEIASPYLRLLFAMPSNSFDQFRSLQKVLDSLRDICNAGWNITVVIQSSSGFNEFHPMYKVLSDRLYCIQSQSTIPIIVMVTSASTCNALLIDHILNVFPS